MKSEKTYLITTEFQSPLSKLIKKEYNALVTVVSALDLDSRNTKSIDNMHEKISASDLIAYQIGWGTLLITWYESGLKNETPQMPGQGFTKWDYTGIARHFYKKYLFDGASEQSQVFHDVVTKILCFTEHEYKTENLDIIGVWHWCTLASGKQWPLSKWIKINTAAPYKRATGLIKKGSS